MTDTTKAVNPNPPYDAEHLVHLTSPRLTTSTAATPENDSGG
jgi:hypothetical protein